MKPLTPFEEALQKLKALSNTVFVLKEAERLGLLDFEQITLLRRYEKALHQCRPEGMKDPDPQ